MTVADIQKATLGPIIGAIPAIRTATGEANAEMTLAEEAIEKTRANLMQQFGKPGGKVVMVTSALTDEGRTFLPRELSLSFARGGAQTLLVDFDLRMPTTDGLQLLEWVRSRPELARLKVMIITADDDPDDIMRVRAAGADGYFTKYPSAAKLAAILANIVPESVNLALASSARRGRAI